MEKHHWKQLINLDYIGAYSLNGKDLTVKIISVSKEIVIGQKGRKETCIVARLEGQKPFIINRTNAKDLTKLFKSPYVEDWAGRSFTLYSSTTLKDEETVECLRIRPQLPQTAKPKQILTTEHQKWSEVVAWVKNGGAYESLLTRYDISPEVEAQLRKEAGI